MTTAFFKKEYTDNKGVKYNMGCTVVLKDDGKISITKKWGAKRKPDYYKLEKDVKEGVKAGFIDPGFSKVTKEQFDTRFSKVYNDLLEQTLHFKTTYIGQVINWSSIDFDKMLNIKEEDVLKEKGYEWRSGIRSHTNKSINYWNNIQRIIKEGKDNYVNSEIEKAECHYKSSIQKLVYRIESKGLDFNNIKINTNYINFGRDGSIETFITDGNRHIRAFTILAGGFIQKPHYRYLIK